MTRLSPGLRARIRAVAAFRAAIAAGRSIRYDGRCHDSRC